jgi:hypothetical protein
MKKDTDGIMVAPFIKGKAREAVIAAALAHRKLIELRTAWEAAGCPAATEAPVKAAYDEHCRLRSLAAEATKEAIAKQTLSLFNR